MEASAGPSGVGSGGLPQPAVQSASYATSLPGLRIPTEEQRLRFRDSMQAILFGCGDTIQSDPATLNMLEESVTQFMRALMQIILRDYQGSLRSHRTQLIAAIAGSSDTAAAADDEAKAAASRASSLPPPKPSPKSVISALESGRTTDSGLTTIRSHVTHMVAAAIKLRHRFSLPLAGNQEGVSWAILNRLPPPAVHGGVGAGPLSEEVTAKARGLATREERDAACLHPETAAQAGKRLELAEQAALVSTQLAAYQAQQSKLNSQQHAMASAIQTAHVQHAQMMHAQAQAQAQAAAAAAAAAARAGGAAPAATGAAAGVPSAAAIQAHFALLQAHAARAQAAAAAGAAAGGAGGHGAASAALALQQQQQRLYLAMMQQVQAQQQAQAHAQAQAQSAAAATAAAASASAASGGAPATDGASSDSAGAGAAAPPAAEP